MPATPDLLPELHRLHQQVHELREQLARGPRQVKAREQTVAAKKDEQQKLKDKLITLRKLADQKNLQLKSNESKILDLKGKLNAVSTNKEYEIISTQIAADTMANSVLETEILEAFENVDACQKQIARCDADVAELQKKVEETRKQVDAVRDDLERRAGQVEAELTEKERELPVELLDVYRRLVQAHGAEALAKVEKDVCTSCYKIISPQERVQLNTNKILFCRSCGRLMYRVKGE